MDQSTEGVFFQIGIEEHPETNARLGKFTEGVLRVHQIFGESIKAIGQSSIEEMQRIASERDKLTSSRSGRSESLSESRVSTVVMQSRVSSPPSVVPALPPAVRDSQNRQRESQSIQSLSVDVSIAKSEAKLDELLKQVEAVRGQVEQAMEIHFDFQSPKITPLTTGDIVGTSVTDAQKELYSLVESLPKAVREALGRQSLSIDVSSDKAHENLSALIQQIAEARQKVEQAMEINIVSPSVEPVKADDVLGTLTQDVTSAVDKIGKLRIQIQKGSNPTVEDIVGKLPEEIKARLESIRSNPVTLEVVPPITAKDILGTGLEDAKKEFDSLVESMPQAIRDSFGRQALTIDVRADKAEAQLRELVDQIAEVRSKVEQTMELHFVSPAVMPVNADDILGTLPKDVENAVDEIARMKVRVEAGEAPTVEDVLGDLPKEVTKEIDNLRKTPITLDVGPPLTVKDILGSSLEDTKKQLDALAGSVEGSTSDIRAAISAQAAEFGDIADELAGHLGVMATKSEQASDKFVAGVGSILNSAKGFAQLGVLQNDSSEAMLKNIVAIEGVYNALKGGIDTIKTFSDGWKAARASVQAATAAQAIQDAMAGPRFNALRAHITQLVIETEAANADAVAHGRLATAKTAAALAGSTPTGAAAGVAGQVASTAVSSTAKSAAQVAGGVVVGAAVTQAATPGVLQTIGAMMGPITAGAAAIAGAGTTFYLLGETVTGSAKKVGSLTDRIASWEVGLVDALGRATGAFDLTGKGAVEKAEKSAARLRENVDRRDALKAEKDKEERYFQNQDLAAARQIESRKTKQSDDYSREDVTAKFGANSAEAKANEMRIQTEATKQNVIEQQRIAQFIKDGQTGAEAYRDALERAAEHQSRIEQSGRAALRLTQEEGRSKVESARVALNSVQQELEQRRKMVQESQQQYESAAERFADMSATDRIEANRALRQAQAGRDISGEDRRLLRSVGTDEANELARRDALADAQRLGFGNTFGASIEKETQQRQAEALRVEAKVLAQQNINMQLTVDTDQLAATAVAAFRQEEARINQETERKILEGVNQNKSEYRREAQERAITQARNGSR